ncbi:MAG: isoprenylcysteine carboxylmethyltransferase family protein, partial [Planctomycetales bacterium]|nr:isoprenylcysteine carboxylmethyltransferase family protein [Planctomycetales bacterium]
KKRGMSTPLQASTWESEQTTFVPAALHNWLARRRVALSLIGFTTLITYNFAIRQTVPYNPLAVGEPLVILALLLLGTGLAIRSWSAGTLNKSRELTMVGPYAVLRNPLYVGSFLMMFAFCLLCRDWLTMAFVAGPLSFLYWLQIRFEERRLANMFASQWPEYARQTPRFLPRRWSRQALQGWSRFEWQRNREYRTIAATGLGLAAVFAWHLAVR